MSPKLVNKQKRKEELALTALNVFAEKGFETTSIDEIAKAANIAKGTVYKYFESKDELIYQSLMAWTSSFEKEISKIKDTIEDPERCLRALISSSMELFINDPRVIRLSASIFQLMLTHKELLKKYDIVRDSLKGMRRMIVDIILTGVSRGIFRPEIASNAEKIAINLTAYLDGIALHYFISNNFFNLMEQVDFYMDELIRDLKPAQKKE